MNSNIKQTRSFVEGLLNKIKSLESELAEQKSNAVLAQRIADLTRENSTFQTRNAELMAQVQRFYEFVNFVVNCCEMSKDHFDYGTKLLSDFIEVKSKPTQCLAERDREVAAKAVEEATTEVIGNFDFGQYRANLGLLDELDGLFSNYANKIKSGEVEI